jgi:hypothetical protein
MKRYLFFLREVRQVLLTGSSYSTIRTCVASLVFVLLAINCGPPPQGQYYVPETAIKAAEKNTTAQSRQSQEGSLPESAIVRLQRMPYLRNAFKQPPPTARRSGLDDFYAKTRGTVQNATIISGGSLDILKAFVAKGWAPIVMVELQGRNTKVLPVTRYNDNASEIFLQNPTNLAERRLSYDNFEKYWAAGSQSKCVLITPRKLTEVDIQNVLGRYLPAAAFQEISVRSR